RSSRSCPTHGSRARTPSAARSSTARPTPPTCSSASRCRTPSSRKPDVRAHDSYDYAVIRVVPRVERGEFVNVGVIVSCEKTGYLKAVIEADEARLRALDPRIDLATLHRHLDAIRRI